jgi:hypothetical protein
MEENKEQNDTEKNSDKVDSIEPLTPVIKHESKSDKDDTESKYGTNSNQSETTNPERLIPNISKDKWIRADKLSLAQTIINGVMTFATLLLLFFAIQQINEARKSNAISENNYKLAKEAFDKGEEESRERYKLDSINTNTQIMSLKEQVNFLKNQFETENLPYLKTDFFSVDRQQSQPWTFKVRVYNIGKYPAKIISKKFRVSMQSSVFNKQSFFKDTKSENVSFYVTEKYPLSVDITYDSLKGTDSPEDIQTGKKNIYFAGDIVYIDMVTNKKRRFEFVYKTMPSKYFNMEQVKIDNYAID